MPHVKGHVRDGRWVRPHYRRPPNAGAGLAAVGVVAALAYVGINGSAQPSDQHAPGAVASSAGIVDGDTIRVPSGSSSTRVRILGIDAPEIAQRNTPAECGAKAATAALKRLVAGQMVTLTSDPTQWDKDVHGRPLRYVAVNGHDVGLSLIKQGDVREFDHGDIPFERRKSYLSAQQDAKKHHRGLWRTCAR